MAHQGDAWRVGRRCVFGALHVSLAGERRRGEELGIGGETGGEIGEQESGDAGFGAAGQGELCELEGVGAAFRAEWRFLGLVRVGVRRERRPRC